MNLVTHVMCRTALSASKLPGLDWALNPYRGCAHGCLYCYVQDVTGFATDRPWGTAVEAKVNIARKLKMELGRGVKGVVGVGTVTDPYQPAEEHLGLTRSCLGLLKRYGAKVSVLTKSDLVLRDLGIYSGWEGAEIGLSIGCPDDGAAALLEPGAPSPSRRFAALKGLSSAGLETYLMAAPIVPSLSGSDSVLRDLVSKASQAGVGRIMWDGLNPRPVAARRMGASPVFQKADLELARSSPWSSRVRIRLMKECEEHGITLVDAF